MTIPPEIAWIVPIVVPFILELLVGIVVKKSLNSLLIIAALVIALIAAGAV